MLNLHSKVTAELAPVSNSLRKRHTTLTYLSPYGSECRGSGEHSLNVVITNHAEKCARVWRAHRFALKCTDEPLMQFKPLAKKEDKLCALPVSPTVTATISVLIKIHIYSAYTYSPKCFTPTNT